MKSFHLKCCLLILLIFLTSSYQLTCYGRGIFTKITIKNNAGYTPYYYINFGLVYSPDKN